MSLWPTYPLSLQGTLFSWHTQLIKNKTERIFLFQPSVSFSLCLLAFQHMSCYFVLVILNFLLLSYFIPLVSMPLWLIFYNRKGRERRQNHSGWRIKFLNVFLFWESYIWYFFEQQKESLLFSQNVWLN